MDFRIEGGQQLAALAKDLKAAGRNDLRKQMLKELRTVQKPAVEAATETARHVLPHHGGLNELVKFAPRTSLSGDVASLRVVGSMSKSNLRLINSTGLVRHPVFGHRDRWTTTSVPAGWFEQSMSHLSPTVQAAMLRVVRDIANRIED